MPERTAAPPTTPTTPAAVAPARGAAFAILQRVQTTAAHSDGLLHAPAVNALSAEDRNLTTALVLGVLRWQLALDAAMLPLLQRPDAELHPAALLALRLGAFQLLYLDRIPAHAAVHESVELARANGAAHAAGMVNAVLRRLAREQETKTGAARQTLAALSPAELAHPHWLLQRWRTQYGGKTARMIAGYDQAEPPAHALFAPNDALPAIDDGSRLVAELAAAAHHAPKRILDACAAPGGKTLVLAHRHAAAEIVAADVSEKRLAAMRNRIDREPHGSRIQTVVADMAAHTTKLDAEESLRGEFDLILCDAPCSGTGTLARNPEIRHRLHETDLPRQTERQRAILANAAKRLAPGGRLVYSTCSLEREENEAVANAVLQSGGLQVLPLRPLLEGLHGLHAPAREHLLDNAITSEGALRTLPGIQPCDGFYAVVLERKS